MCVSSLHFTSTMIVKEYGNKFRENRNYFWITWKTTIHFVKIIVHSPSAILGYFGLCMLRHKEGPKLYFRVYFQHHIHCQHFKHLLVVWLWCYVSNQAFNVTKITTSLFARNIKFCLYRFRCSCGLLTTLTSLTT